jgi:hypothetical protein
MAKGPDLALNVGRDGSREVDVYARPRGLEIFVDGARVTPTRLGGTTKGTERWEVWVDGIEPCTVTIERLGGRRAPLQAYVDGWPTPDGRAAARAARRQAAGKTRSAKATKGGRAGRRYVFAGVVAVLVLWGFAIFARNQVNDASIASHGRAVDARIVGTSHVDDDNGSSDFLSVWLPACNCPVQLATDNPAAHPRGSTIRVLYDTTDPTNARPLVDGNSTKWGWATDALFFGLAAFGIYCIYESVIPEISPRRAHRMTSRGTNRFPGRRARSDVS